MYVGILSFALADFVKRRRRFDSIIYLIFIPSTINFEVLQMLIKILSCDSPFHVNQS
jgi:hypothetical protein